MKKKHDRQATLEPRLFTKPEEEEDATVRQIIRTRARSPPPTQSGSSSHPQQIYSRKIMLAGKGKAIEQETEHERSSKKAKQSQEGLDEDILNMINKATANEISWLKGWEDLIDFNVGEGAEVPSGSGLKDQGVVVVEEEEEKEKEEEGGGGG
ncbi:hypothetical protein L1987_48651 [Smallanthus sonchifolius]|uniref:Uncharacterized protein n=1 Tax=Smallanthus sonchifolius TaxID=185202 RepID=A0ACB9FTJ6_9ASTR|nr:hypothetical protein L1987_48651 [Smallanthus sonchifolius]